MKTKTFGLFALSILALIFLMSGVSAASLNLVPVSVPTIISQGTTSINVTFNVSNGGATNYSALDWSGSSSNIGSWTTLPSLTTLNVGEEKTLYAVLTIPSTFLGNINATIDLQSETTAQAQLPINIVVTSNHPQDVLDCQATGNPGNLEVKKIDFTNRGITYANFEGDDDQWFPFEKIEVDVEIESDDYDIDDISFEWGIYSLDDKDWLIELDEEDEFNLKDGDQETYTITFKLDDDLDIDLDEFIDNSNNYRFYVIATGTIDDNNAGADDGEDTCDFDYESASIIIEKDFVIIDNIDLPETLSCGETVTVTADVWNIGDRDQDDVSVDVLGRESILDFRKTVEVGNIDAFDRQQMTFTFTVPQDIEEKYYALNFEVNDEDRDVYENDFDDDLSKFTIPFKVEGNCGGAISDVLISASLESEAKAGKEMIIKATVTNNGDELETFTINAIDFAIWADLISQDQNVLVLNAGQSRDVLFTFDVNDDVSGTQTFFIELVSGDNITKQPVSVNIEESKPFFGITGFAVKDASLWGLGLLNVILILIIIIVAVRVARRR